MRSEPLTRACLWALVIVAIIGTACASGGGGVILTPDQVAALRMEYSGNWVLDETGSSPKSTSVSGPTRETVTAVVPAQDLERFRRELEAEARTQAIRAATLQILHRRPGTLSIQVEGEELVYNPTPGTRIALPLDGGTVSDFEGESSIRTRLILDGPGLDIEHTVDSEGQINAVLEIVGGRLKITRTMQIVGETIAPIVLVYDREGAGGGGPLKG